MRLEDVVEFGRKRSPVVTAVDHLPGGAPAAAVPFTGGAAIGRSTPGTTWSAPWTTCDAATAPGYVVPPDVAQEWATAFEADRALAGA